MIYRRNKDKTSLAPLLVLPILVLVGGSVFVWASYKDNVTQNSITLDNKKTSSISVVLSKRSVSTPLFTMELTEDWQLNEKSAEEGEYYHYMKTVNGTVEKHIKIATSQPKDLRVTRVLPAEVNGFKFAKFDKVSDHCGEEELEALPSINYLCYHDGTRFSLEVLDKNTNQAPVFGSYTNPRTLHIYFIDYNVEPSSDELERILSTFKAT